MSTKLFVIETAINMPHGVTSHLTEFNPSELNFAAYNPAERTEAKAIERLLQSIKTLGNNVVNPIHVYGGPAPGKTDDHTNEILDGHRRTKCALTLGLTKIRGFVHYGPYKVVKQLFVELNASSKKMTKRQMMESMYKDGPEFDEVAAAYHQLQSLLSDFEFEMFIERGIAPFCLGLAKSCVKYINVKPEAAKYNDWLRSSVLWLAFTDVNQPTNGGQQQQAKAFMRHFSIARDKKSTYSVSLLRKAIEDSKPLAW
jgi:hypothetical protein